MPTNLQQAQRYLKSIEEGEFETDLFAPTMIMEQFPNRIYPKGIRAGLSQMANSFKTGKKLFSRQSYEIKNAIAQGEWLSLEVLWTGVLALPLGTLAAGDEMRAYSAMFLEFKDGKIVSQRNYDCFEPW